MELDIDRELVIQSFDKKPLLQMGDFKFLVNSLTEQVPATTAKLLEETTRWLVSEGDFGRATKIAGEEDKGAILVASTSLMTGLPFGMARWIPSGIEGQVAVEFAMEYASGTLYLNGVEPGDRVIVVDDMISTGGTMLALIKAIELARASIVDIVCVAEKLDYGGVARVEAQTGYTIKSLVKILLAGDVSQVVR